MGYYIQTSSAKGKALEIMERHNAKIFKDGKTAPKWEDHDPLFEAIICVVDNGPFEAAAFAYSPDELADFAAPDVGGGLYINGQPSDPTSIGKQRPRTWLLMDRKLAKELTKYKGD